jgi:hypothetical protein
MTRVEQNKISASSIVSYREFWHNQQPQRIWLDIPKAGIRLVREKAGSGATSDPQIIAPHINASRTFLELAWGTSTHQEERALH